MSEPSPIGRLLICLSTTFGIWLVWIATANFSMLDGLRTGLTLLSYAIALAGMASLFAALKMDGVYAAALTVLLAFAWLTWPIWLSPWLGGSHAQAIVDALVAAHPLMAMNAILFTRFNIWDRYTLSYQQLTILNQDIFYALPRSIAWMVCLHLLVGLGGLSADWLGHRRRERRDRGHQAMKLQERA